MSGRSGNFGTSRRLKRQEAPKLPDRPDITPEFRCFVGRCLQFDSVSRPSARDLLQDPFLRVLPSLSEADAPSP